MLSLHLYYVCRSTLMHNNFFLLTERKTRGVLLILDSNLADLAHQLNAGQYMQL